MQRDNNNIGISCFISIAILVLFAGCVNSLPPPEAPPGEVVKAFASTGGSYDLMSEVYKNSTSRWVFKDITNKCSPSDWGGYYKFVEVINGSEKIEGSIASMDIRYLVKRTDSFLDEFENKTKTIYLVREENGWRLQEPYCELRSK